MGQCVATIKGNEKCGKETEPGYRYCDEHKNRKRAVTEREERSVGTIIDASEAFTPQFVADNRTAGEIEVTKAETLPATNRGNIFERTMNVLDRAQDWEEKTWEMLMTLRPDEMRYNDKAGAEQTHSYVSMNERAQDRTIRAVTAIAKLDIDAQSVNVNKMVQEVIKSVVTKALTRTGMAPSEIEQVRIYMAEEFEKVAKESNERAGNAR